MIGSVVDRLVTNDNSKRVYITGFEELTKEQQRVVVASSVTFLMGIFQVEYIYKEYFYQLQIITFLRWYQDNTIHY